MRARHRILSSSAVLLLLASPGLARQRVTPVPDRAPGTVTLPVAEYDRLLDRAAQLPAPLDQPPIPAVVARADVAGRVEADVVRGTLRLEGEVFQRGAVKVPLASGTTITDAKSDGRVLPLVHESSGVVGILSGPAPFVVTLDWTAPVELTPGRASVVLPQPASGTGTATLDLPGEVADVRVEAGLITERQAANGRTVVRITLPPGSRARVSWSVRESASQAVPAEVRTLGEVKSLVTIGDGDLRLTSLVDVVVVRGEPTTFEIQVPAGYTLAAVSGPTLERYEPKGSAIAVTVREPERRRHQFLVTLEQPHAAGSFKADTAFPAVAGVQRESGELAIEGTGTMEVTPSADDTLRRMDVREINPALRSLTRQPLLAAFRYQRRPGEVRRLALDVTRFPDAPVLSAIADSATATTLVTTEGRMLTEITLLVRNRAQPFMKVTLPPAASILSSEVAGEPARPVSGPDGTRVPLLRANFRPEGPYSVSFVYLHGSQPFARSGDAQMALATIDLPVGLLEWELFLPEQYSAKPVAGNVIPASLAGFGSSNTAQHPGTLAETVQVSVATPDSDLRRTEPRLDEIQQAPSQNVVNMQRKVAGVLPVRIDVPRAGTAYRFVRPLVLDDQTTVSFRYKRR